MEYQEKLTHRDENETTAVLQCNISSLKKSSPEKEICLSKCEICKVQKSRGDQNSANFAHFGMNCNKLRKSKIDTFMQRNACNTSVCWFFFLDTKSQIEFISGDCIVLNCISIES